MCLPSLGLLGNTGAWGFSYFMQVRHGCGSCWDTLWMLVLGCMQKNANGLLPSAEVSPGLSPGTLQSCPWSSRREKLNWQPEITSLLTCHLHISDFPLKQLHQNPQGQEPASHGFLPQSSQRNWKMCPNLPTRDCVQWNGRLGGFLRLRSRR